MLSNFETQTIPGYFAGVRPLQMSPQNPKSYPEENASFFHVKGLTIDPTSDYIQKATKSFFFIL